MRAPRGLAQAASDALTKPLLLLTPSFASISDLELHEQVSASDLGSVVHQRQPSAERVKLTTLHGAPAAASHAAVDPALPYTCDSNYTRYTQL